MQATTLRAGLTLIELLVVMSIMMVLAIVAVPAMRPAMEGRRLRETARAINVFLSTAQNRASESNLMFGVELERDPNLVLGCRTLYQVEVPLPYGGELSTSVIRLAPIGTPGSDNLQSATVQFCTDSTGIVFEDPISVGFVRPGDEIRVNFSGNRWFIRRITGGPNTWYFEFYVPPGSSLPSVSAPGMPYQVFRQPVRSHATPLQLPRDVVVDLSFSGTQNSFWPYDNNDRRSVVILFNSRRAVDRIYTTDVTSNYYNVWRAVRPVYLLVGRRDRVPAMIPNPVKPPDFIPGPSPAEDGGSNLLDLGNLWVAINPQTGLISAAEMAATSPASPSLDEARAFAREFQSTGGR